MRKELIILIIVVVISVCTASAILLNNNPDNMKTNTSNPSINNTTNNQTDNNTSDGNDNLGDPEYQKENYMGTQPTKVVDGVKYKLIYDDNGNPSYWVSMDLEQKKLPLNKNSQKSSTQKNSEPVEPKNQKVDTAKQSTPSYPEDSGYWDNPES